MDQQEAFQFVDEFAKYFIDQTRAKNFTFDKFRDIFIEFDEDKNGFLSKPEMAVLIKKVFKSSDC